jgi:hypothetical protein
MYAITCNNATRLYDCSFINFADASANLNDIEHITDNAKEILNKAQLYGAKPTPENFDDIVRVSSRSALGVALLELQQSWFVWCCGYSCKVSPMLC